MAILLVLAAAFGRPGLRGVALVFALLAAVNTVVWSLSRRSSPLISHGTNRA